MAKETVKTIAEEVKPVAAKVEKTEKVEKAETVKATAKKSTAAKKTTKKADATSAKAEKKTTKKTTTKTAAPKVEMFIQYNDNQLDEATLLQRVKDDCTAQGVKAKEIKLYVKPQDNACYYVANGNFAGKVELF